MSNGEKTWSQYIDSEVWKDEARLKSLFTDFSSLLEGQGVDQSWKRIWIQEANPFPGWVNEWYDDNYREDEETGEFVEVPADVAKAEIEGMIRAKSVDELKEDFDFLAKCVQEAVRYI